MLRKLLICGAAALVLVAPATAATKKKALMPGVTYRQSVQFTPHGPVALHVVTGPRPTGLYELRPVLSNDRIQGLERVSSMQERLSSQATMVGINGDFYNFDSGRPSGVLVRDGVVDSPPNGDRSSVGITPTGTLDVRRVEFFGTWKGLGQRRALNDVNQLPGANGISLFTPSYGPTTPKQDGAVEAVVAPFPPTAPNTDLTGPVVHLTSGGGTPIPDGGAVLVARGTAGQKLAEEAPIGTTVALRIIFRPEWTEVSQAIGGGPVIVRDGAPVFRSLEAFEPNQLLPRNPRTAVGQLGNGRVILVATDGRRPGYSVGMTNFELAQTMVRLGAVTASAFDAGGSTTLAFDGEVLNRPSDGGERAVSTSLQLMYYGVYTPAVKRVISPNGDRVDETQELSYKVVRPSNVVVTLRAPGGEVAFTETVQREPGTYPVAFPPVPADPNAEPAPPAEGRWQLEVAATDDVGRASTTRERFTVNNTLGNVALARRKITVRARGRQFQQAGVDVTHAARLRVTVETRSGVRVATIANRRITKPGRYLVRWRGTTRGGRLFVYGGKYVLRFRAANELGVVELTSKPFTVERVKPKPKKGKAKKPVTRRS